MDRIKPMLGDLELQQVQQLDIEADQLLTEHEIPALEGNFFQPEGRRGSLITVSGVISGLSKAQFPDQPEENPPEIRLQGLREKFRAAEPVTFVSDIISATDLDKVLIEDMEITELAGKPNRFEYAFRLREYTEPPSQPSEPPPVDPPPQTLAATLVVEVIAENDPNFDFSRVTVTVKGTTAEGEDLDRTLSNRNNNIWTEEDFPPGNYTAEAVVTSSPQMRDSKSVEVRAGETANVTLVLRQGVTVAKTFMIHFRFDSAFVEPCMMHVLKQVAEFSSANSSDKFLVVGHTDLSGSTAYNQSLSERRARSSFSALRFGNDNQAAVDEWNAIRRTRSSGVSLGDSWGTREYQQMLQDLGFYKGAIDGQHGPGTDAAVKEFQTANTLTPDGNVGDGTWPVLIRHYLAQYNLSVADDRLLPNCSGESLKWLGCSELDPVRNTPNAWRPNRRSEFFFVQDTSLPADVPEPVTFNLPAPGAVNNGWCLNPGNVTSRCCFVEPHLQPRMETCSPNRSPWVRQPAEPQPVFAVKGSIHFSDGTPYNGDYVLIAPDGEFMDGEVPVSTGSQRAGTPFKGTTAADGSFSYASDNTKHKRPGIFTLEVDGDFVVRNRDASLTEAKGPITCKRLASDTDSFDVIVVPQALANIIPSITAPSAVVVKKAHTSPQRQPVVLQINQSFSGTGTLSLTPANTVKLFTAAAGGTPLQFNGTDNVFTDAQLLAGVTLFAEGGPDPSTASNDTTLSLQVLMGSQIGHRADHVMTSVLVTLDIGSSQTNAAGNVIPLTAVTKVNPGRILQIQNPQFSAVRALVIARRTQPADFVGNLVLQALNNRVRLFSASEQNAAAGQTPQVLPITFDNQTVPQTPSPAPTPDLTGQQFWAEAVTVSNAVTDTGFQLGIENLEADGDRVMITAADVSLTNNTAPFTTAVTRVQVEGVLNRTRTSFDIGDLFNAQAGSLFRARITLPGITGNSLQATLESRDQANALLENHVITLTRTTGNIFVTATPILAIPDAIPRADITFAAPQDIDVVRCRAQGKLRLRVNAPNADAGTVQVNVRGRVLQFCTITIQGATPTLNSDLTTANRVVAQCGIEFRVLNSSTVNNPVLLDIAQTDCPLTVGGDTTRGTEETSLFALGRTTCTNNFIVYFVRSNSMGLAGCSAYPVGQPGVSVADSASQYTFGHEICHVLNLPHDGRTNNLMTGTGTGGLPAANNLVRLEPDQALTLDGSGFLAFLE